MAFPAVWAGSRSGGRLYRTSSEAVYRWTGIVVLGATSAILALKSLTGLG